MNNLNDLVFECRKCGHLLFITGTATEKIKKITKLDNYVCDNCGAEREGNWAYLRKGNYEKEFGSEQ
jgi:transcription elongation factor Elf1